MAFETAERFMRTLQEAERSGDVAGLVALFSTDARLSNLAGEAPLEGRPGASAFWSAYLGVFDTIRSRFTHVTEGPDRIVLEWVSDGALRGGSTVSYQGVSVLETSDGLVRRFRSYYDSAALRPIAVAKA